MATAPHVSTVPGEGPCSRPSLASRALPALRGSVLSCHRPCAGTWADGTATAWDTSGDGDGGKNAKTPGSRSFRLEVTLSLLLAVPEPGESRGRAEAPRGLGAGARWHRGHHALPRGLSCAVHRGHSCAAPANLGIPSSGLQSRRNTSSTALRQGAPTSWWVGRISRGMPPWQVSQPGELRCPHRTPPAPRHQRAQPGEPARARGQHPEGAGAPTPQTNQGRRPEM